MDRINIESMVSGTVGSENYLKPLVKVTWGREEGMLEPEDARELGLSFIQVAEAAEQDATLVGFLMKKFDAPQELVAAALGALRDYRDLRAAQLKEQSGG